MNQFHSEFTKNLTTHISPSHFPTTVIYEHCTSLADEVTVGDGQQRGC